MLYTLLISFILASDVAPVLPTPILTEQLAHARGVLSTLKTAVTANDPYPIAKMIKFPLRVHLQETWIPITTEAQFVKLYPELFGPDMRASVLCQDPETLVVANEGMAIGGGEIWLRFYRSAGDRDLSSKIIAINSELAPPRALRGNVPCVSSAE